MSGYHNDIEAIVDAVGDRLTLFANIHPVEVIQEPDDASAEVARQATADGAPVASSSVRPPHHPGTGISRIQASSARAVSWAQRQPDLTGAGHGEARPLIGV